MKHADFLARGLVSIATALCVLWGEMSGAIAMTRSRQGPRRRWYRLFILPVQGDMRKCRKKSDIRLPILRRLPAQRMLGAEASIKIVGGFATSIPDLKFQIHAVLSRRRVIVRGEVTGTPSGVCSAPLTPARASGSWPSICRRSETARFPRPTAWRTGERLGTVAHPVGRHRYSVRWRQRRIRLGGSSPRNQLSRSLRRTSKDYDGVRESIVGTNGVLTASGFST